MNISDDIVVELHRIARNRGTPAGIYLGYRQWDQLRHEAQTQFRPVNLASEPETFCRVPLYRVACNDHFAVLPVVPR